MRSRSNPRWGAGKLTTACIIVAAGRGERLGQNTPKAFVRVAGKPILQHALERVLEAGSIREVIVVVPAYLVSLVSRNLAVMKSNVAQLKSRNLVVSAGGATRQESVQCGLSAVSDSVEVVLVHDAARCLAPGELFDAVDAAVRVGNQCVVPTIALTDTIRSLDGQVLDRDGLVACQTPQGFTKTALVQAHQHLQETGLCVTDDAAALAAACGSHPHQIPGHPDAFKVTTPRDLARAESVLGSIRVAPVANWQCELSQNEEGITGAQLTELSEAPPLPRTGEAEAVNQET